MQPLKKQVNFLSSNLPLASVTHFWIGLFVWGNPKKVLNRKSDRFSVEVGQQFSFQCFQTRSFSPKKPIFGKFSVLRLPRKCSDRSWSGFVITEKPNVLMWPKLGLGLRFRFQVLRHRLLSPTRCIGFHLRFLWTNARESKAPLVQLKFSHLSDCVFSGCEI